MRPICWHLPVKVKSGREHAGGHAKYQDRCDDAQYVPNLLLHEERTSGAIPPQLRRWPRPRRRRLNLRCPRDMDTLKSRWVRRPCALFQAQQSITSRVRTQSRRVASVDDKSRQSFLQPMRLPSLQHSGVEAVGIFSQSETRRAGSRPTRPRTDIGGSVNL